MQKLKRLIKDKRGSDSIEFLTTSAMMIAVVAMLICTMAYVAQYYNANYVCRRVVRSIEVTGQYDAPTALSLIDTLAGSGLEDITLDVDAVYFEGNKIQLKNTFTTTLTANYTIKLMTFGGTDVNFKLPIKVKLKGMSEVYWKAT